LANPADRELARDSVEALAKLADECGPMELQRVTALTLLAECALNAGDPQRALTATDAVLAGPFPSSPATRTRFYLCRVRALVALGRRDEATRELEAARLRVQRIAEGLEAADRTNWLALRLVADTLAFAV
jgi:hypothetical protein